MTPISINDHQINCLLDTGANCSLIKESIARRLQCHLTPCSLYLDGIGSGKIHAFSTITPLVKFPDVCIELTIYVVRDSDFKYDCIIGTNALNHPGIAIVSDKGGNKLIRTSVSSKDLIVNSISDQITYTTNAKCLNDRIGHLDTDLQIKIKEIFSKYPNVLPSEVVSTVKTGELKIRLKSDKIINYRPYRLAPIEREKVKEIINDLLNKRVIRESDSDFASPVLLVKKADGSDRLCVDFRALNQIVEKDRYPLPLIQDQLDKLGKAKYFISIDMKNGFYQIPVSPESIKYTAFITPDGQFEF